MSGIVGVIVVFGFVILTHELGHFLVARLLGVAVERFSVGFGPALWSFRSGQTEYRISLLPFGGYVKLAGQDPEAPIPPGLEGHTFPELAPRWRGAILAAGPSANVLLTLAIFMVAFAVFGIGRLLPVVGEVEKDSPAAAAGLRPGDRIVSIAGRPIDRWQEVGDQIASKGGQSVSVVWTRKDHRQQATLVPKSSSVKDAYGSTVERAIIGIGPAGDVAVEKVSVAQAALLGARETLNIGEASLVMLYRLVTGAASISNLVGPVGIAQMSSEAARSGAHALLMVTGIVSANIAIINLLPIPLFDGGGLLFVIIEAVRKRPVRMEVQQRAQVWALFFLLMLAVVVIGNDIQRLTGAP